MTNNGQIGTNMFDWKYLFIANHTIHQLDVVQAQFFTEAKRQNLLILTTIRNAPATIRLSILIGRPQAPAVRASIAAGFLSIFAQLPPPLAVPSLDLPTVTNPEPLTPSQPQ